MSLHAVPKLEGKINNKYELWSTTATKIYYDFNNSKSTEMNTII